MRLGEWFFNAEIRGKQKLPMTMLECGGIVNILFSALDEDEFDEWREETVCKTWVGFWPKQ